MSFIIKSIDSSRKKWKNYKKAWDEREFIAIDGEGTEVEPAKRPDGGPLMEQWWMAFTLKHGVEPGPDEGVTDDLHFTTRDIHPQPYVLLANSKGDRITNQDGLSTEQCFDFLIDMRQKYNNAIFVGFGLGYDIAQWLKDLPEMKLWILYEYGKVRWGKYYLKWLSRRILTISRKDAMDAKPHGVTIYDTFGFFQTSFIDACEEYLGKDDPRLAAIREGKAGRETFKWEELDDFIIPYNEKELEMLVEMMGILRTDLHNVGLDLTQWHGPGAVASTLLSRHHIERHMTRDYRPEVSCATQFAYAGGRFEQFQIGRHQSTVYEYDIRSAYPAGAITLPSLSKGTWHPATSFKPGTFGVWYCRYREERKDEKFRPQPLFCRGKDGAISFPTEVDGWYWTPEASLVPHAVEAGYYLEPATDERPFSFVNEMYEQRRAYKASGNPAQRALKLSLNSLYGKLAQTVGGVDGPPKWHQLEWAGWITSYTRAAIYNAIMLNPQAIIAAETDAVFSTEPLPLDIGPGLGQWECKTFKEILYVQSGFYYATEDDGTIVCKYRGMDRDRDTQQPVGLPYRTVVDHLGKRPEHPYGRIPALSTTKTRFINVGLALRTNSIFRSWEKTDQKLSFNSELGQYKRDHLTSCKTCDDYTLADCLHPMTIGGDSGFSYPHRLPWVDGKPDDEYTLILELIEADTDDE